MSVPTTVLRDYAARLSQPTLGEASGPARYDEVVGPDGSLRPPWKRLAERAVALTDADLVRVDAEIRRLLADDGVTYSRPGHAPGPWRLDPVPLVLDQEAWAPLEVGLAQRAELLHAGLADLYGERRLLSERVVPAAAVYAHPGYLRVLARPGLDEPRPLVLLGTDLGRDAAGAWRVLADRTAAPSGLGYATENRRVLSRVQPELYRDAGLHRIEPFLSALRSALLQSAPPDLPDPRVVVLSPGAASETAYDQARLASLLGFPLVQGSDLVVRDGWLLMRVVGRLERVDVVLRRVDAAYSDPLELRGDSRLGVAGLTEVVRRGRVRVVNGLGAGVLENPALLPYLPAACELLLGEPLRLPSAPTWWCGEPDGLERVLDHLDRTKGRHAVTVRAVDTPGGTADLTRDLPREQLIEALLAAPHRYVGQEVLPLSQAPVWSGAAGRAGGESLTLRAFTLRYGSSYRTLLGGLGSVLDGGRTVASKDVWVLKDRPDVADQHLAEVLPTVSMRAATSPVPRVLEDMFWSGRYAERAEDLLRLVLVTHALDADFRARPDSVGGAALDVVLRAVVALAGPVGDPAAGPDPTLDRAFRDLLLDPARTGSVAQSVAALRTALEGVRDQLSGDVWRVFGAVDRASVLLRESPYSHQVSESAGRMLTGVLALHGATDSMIRDAGWHTLAVGRHLERALQLVVLLGATTTVRRGIDVDRQVLNAVLDAAESAVTHRRRYRGSVRVGGVLELLLMDADNPRSLAFALDRLAEHLAALPASTGSSRPERLVADLRALLTGTDVATLVAIGGVGRPNLEGFLAATTRALERIADAVAELHLATGPAPRPFPALVATTSGTSGTTAGTAFGTAFGVAR